MSETRLKKPSRPPPKPPGPTPPTSSRASSKNDHYIKISDCWTVTPHERLPSLKSRTSISFSNSSTISSSHNIYQRHHQKSRSLIENNIGSSYLCLDLPSSNHNTVPASSSTVYKQVDFLKTEALTKCKVERNKELIGDRTY